MVSGANRRARPNSTPLSSQCDRTTMQATIRITSALQSRIPSESSSPRQRYSVPHRFTLRMAAGRLIQVARIYFHHVLSFVLLFFFYCTLPHAEDWIARCLLEALYNMWLCLRGKDHEGRTTKEESRSVGLLIHLFTLQLVICSGNGELCKIR